MSIAEFCHTDVSVIEKNSSITSAARLMRENHVGDLIICVHEGGLKKPIGILTDRDIVVGLIALDIPLENVSVDDVMTPSLVTVPKSAGIYETIHLMETYGVRRVPVVDEQGGLYGIISSGDLLEVLGTEILALSRLPSRQKIRESEIRQ